MVVFSSVLPSVLVGLAIAFAGSAVGNEVRSASTGASPRLVVELIPAGGPMPVATCDGPSGAAIFVAKGWCRKLVCATDTCSANWYSLPPDEQCLEPSCPYAVDSTRRCKCVANPEPSGSCGPCNKVLDPNW